MPPGRESKAGWGAGSPLNARFLVPGPDPSPVAEKGPSGIRASAHAYWLKGCVV